MPGWIKLHRKIEDNPLYKDKPFNKSMAWIDLLLLANHESKEFLDHRGNVIQGEQGTVYRSVLFLGERWGWSRDKVNHFLKQLEIMKMIHKNSTTQGTTITIVNYGDYQKKAATDQSTQKQPTDSPPAARKQPADTYKNNKELYKNEEEDNTPLRGQYFDDPNDPRNDVKLLDQFLDCEQFAHADLEKAVMIRRKELGIDE